MNNSYVTDTVALILRLEKRKLSPKLRLSLIKPKMER
jgi:hypothetical protein